MYSASGRTVLRKSATALITEHAAALLELRFVNFATGGPSLEDVNRGASLSGGRTMAELDVAALALQRRTEDERAAWETRAQPAVRDAIDASERMASISKIRTVLPSNCANPSV